MDVCLKLVGFLTLLDFCKGAGKALECSNATIKPLSRLIRPNLSIARLHNVVNTVSNQPDRHNAQNPRPVGLLCQ